MASIANIRLDKFELIPQIFHKYFRKSNQSESSKFWSRSETEDIITKTESDTEVIL